jgi:histidinol-phosphatase (PHP family)
MLPADSHVHSEWSWDYGSAPASAGSMRRICERAVWIGLPAVVFTEHLDFEDAWRVDDGDIGEHAQKYVDTTGHVSLPAFDADGYLSTIDRCRHDYRDLRIITGVEFGQPHLRDAEAAALLSSDAIERVNGSLHMLPFAGSDAHGPDQLAANFPEATAMTEHYGFRPGPTPEAFWTR